MTTEIKNIMSPVRIMKVEDWSKIALAIMSDKETANGQRAMWLRLEWMEELQQRYELLTSRKLEKEMFVCEVQKPIITDVWDRDLPPYKAYSAALKKVLFAGFEIESAISVINGDCEIYFNKPMMRIRDGLYDVDTISDLIYHITKYNETSPSKIQIDFTDSFINELIR